MSALYLQFAKIGESIALYHVIIGDKETKCDLIGLWSGTSESEHQGKEWFTQIHNDFVHQQSISIDTISEIFDKAVIPVVACGVMLIEGGRVLVKSQYIQWYLVREGKVFRLAEGKGPDTFSGWCKSGDELVGLKVHDFGYESGMSREKFVALIKLEKAKDTIIDGGVVIFGHKGGDQSPVVAPIQRPFPSEPSQGQGIPNLRNLASSSPVSEGVTSLEQEKTPTRKTSHRWLQSLVRLLPREDSIYLMQETIDYERVQRGKRWIVLLSFLLLVGLVGMIFYGIKQREQQIFKFTFGGALEQIQYKIAEGTQIAELNPVRARELINEIDGLIGTLEARGFDPTKLSEWKAQLQSLRGLAQRKYAVEPTIWLSLDLVRENVRAEDFSGDEDSLYVLDGEENRVFKIAIENKSPEVLAAQSEIGDSQQLAVSNQNVYVYGEKGVLQLNRNKDTTVLPGTSAELGEIRDLETFGANVYAFSTNGIWRWSSIETGWQGPEQWLEEKMSAPWIDPVSSEIDGVVWVAIPQSIRKYIRGVEEGFSIQGLEEPLSGIADLYTSEASSRLYVLDMATKRVVIVDKESGIYERAYTWEGLDQVIGIHVSEDRQKMWWLTPERIYEVPLK